MGEEKASASRAEPRWPVAITILATIGLLLLLHDQIRLAPAWVPCVAGITVLTPMAVIPMTGAKRLWQALERIVVLLYVILGVAGDLASLANLINEMVRRSSQLGGLELFESSIAVWLKNVLMFSLLYWQVDRGGPGARANGAEANPDWLFPQEGTPGMLVPGWRPGFVDYLFLAYSTATAFSTTDVIPMTSRAKMLMMLESTISLLTIVVVAARAINILGG